MVERKREKNQPQKKHKNTTMNGIAALFSVLFLLMVFYLLYFTVNQREIIVNNEYNRRIDALEEKVFRGNIMSADGQVLAVTKKNQDGTFFRDYPYGNIFAHVVGISKMGKSGIEKMMNYYLLTSRNSFSSEFKDIIQGNATIGDTITTTLDTRLQKAAYEALGDNKGAVVVIEPSTGKVRAMVSKPDFDPNYIEVTWDSIMESSDSVLFNRATQGLYPPGSTFKIITLLEYMREEAHYEDYTYECDGSIFKGGFILNCINGKAHGKNSLLQAFAKSCNSAFGDIGLRLDKKKFIETVESLLFNQELDFPMEYNKSSFLMTKEADDARVMQTAIGQADTLISPFHNALIVSAIANKGVLMKPYLVEKISSVDESNVITFEPDVYKTLLSSEEASQMTTYLKAVVTEGTAYSLKDAPYESAGKTGSAQFDNSDKHHSWFVGFAPANNPQIAISVVLEGGYTGMTGAHEVARKVFDAYFGEK